MTTLLTNDRLAKLQAELASAQARSKEMKAELATAQRKADRAEGRVIDLQEEIAQYQIANWGNTPDWSLMLAAGTTSMYQALDAHLARIGLSMHFSWSDTKEQVVCIAINSGEIDAVARNAAAVRLLVPHMKAHAGGAVWFKIRTSVTDSMWTLRAHKKKGTCELVQEVVCSVEARLPFPTLEAALGHVQRYLWDEDILDAQPIALIEHTETST
jgi:hypothetical protein